MNCVDLPLEILNHIAGYLEERQDVLNMRLVRRNWSAAATQLAFSKLTLRPALDSIKRWIQLSKNPQIRLAVRQVSIHTTDDDRHKSIQDVWEETSETWNDDVDLISYIKDFPYLNRVDLRFSAHCIGFRPPPSCPYSARFPDYEAEEIGERQYILVTLFDAWNSREPGSSKIHSLRIENLQNIPLPDFTSTPTFKTLIGNLDELHLGIVEEYNEAGSDGDLYCEERVKFEPYLTEHWLSLGSQLTVLSISFKDNWGTIPGTFTGQGLHFPQLKKLTLGSYCVSHDDHLDWVLNQTSLEHLRLDSCCIVSHIFYDLDMAPEWNIKMHDWVQITEGLEEDFGDPMVAYYYGGSWDFIFERIRTGLPNLTQFEFDIKWTQRYVVFSEEWIECQNDSGEIGTYYIGPLNRHQEQDEQDNRSLEMLKKTMSDRRTSDFLR